MPYLIALFGMASAVIFWYFRLRDTGANVADMANDVRLAARRFGFNRKANTHPVDSIDDARLAAAGILVIAAESDGAISQSEKDVFLAQCIQAYKCSPVEADEFLFFDRWLANVDPIRDETIRRSLRKLLQLGGAGALADLGGMVCAVGQADAGKADDNVEDILERLKRASH